MPALQKIAVGEEEFSAISLASVREVVEFEDYPKSAAQFEDVTLF